MPSDDLSPGEQCEVLALGAEVARLLLQFVGILEAVAELDMAVLRWRASTTM